MRQVIALLMMLLCFDAQSQKTTSKVPPLPQFKTRLRVIDPNDTQPPAIGAFDFRGSEMRDFPISVPFNFSVVQNSFVLNFPTVANHYYTAWKTDDLNVSWVEPIVLHNAAPARSNGVETVSFPIQTNGTAFFQIRANPSIGVVWPEREDMKRMFPLLLAAGLARAAEIPPVEAPEPSKSYLDGVTLSPFGAMRSIDITDGEQWGAGLDLGVPLNKYVSVHAQALGYSDNDWRGPAIDEVAVLAKADLVRYADERLKLYALGGADRSFDVDDWAFGIGAGLNLILSKNVSIGVDSRIRAWFDRREEDLLSRALLSISF